MIKNMFFIQRLWSFQQLHQHVLTRQSSPPKPLIGMFLAWWNLLDMNNINKHLFCLMHILESFGLPRLYNISITDIGLSHLSHLIYLNQLKVHLHLLSQPLIKRRNDFIFNLLFKYLFNKFHN